MEKHIVIAGRTCGHGNGTEITVLIGARYAMPAQGDLDLARGMYWGNPPPGQARDAAGCPVPVMVEP